MTRQKDAELENVGDFGEQKFDPDSVANTADERAELDTERYYQPRDDKPSSKRAPGGKGNPEKR